VAARFTELIVDAADPRALARWWADVLGWRVTDEDDEGTEIADPGGALPTIVFVPVPEAKAGKNRLHIDVSPVGCDQDEELQRLLSLGATRTDVGQGDDVTWVVLADPEGNEFCLLRRPVEAAPRPA
jgi:predicted enzyme related to lactoylglutathione lyase